MSADEVDRDQLVAELRLLRGMGLARMRERRNELNGLTTLAEFAYGSDDIASVEAMLRDAWHALGDGPHGMAVGLLFGLERGHRGGNPTALRSKAANRLGYASVETFRKRPEAAAISSFADELVSLRAQRSSLNRSHGDDRVAQVVALIEALTTVESAELARRLRERFGDS
jgi:hypothetical protein